MRERLAEAGYVADPTIAAALVGLDVEALDRAPDKVQMSLIWLLKTERDAQAVTGEVVARLVGRAA